MRSSCAWVSQPRKDTPMTKDLSGQEWNPPGPDYAGHVEPIAWPTNKITVERDLYLRPGHFIPLNLTASEIDQFMKQIYWKSGLPDFVFLALDRARELGLVTESEYRWLKFKHSVGQTLQNVISGAQSVL